MRDFEAIYETMLGERIPEAAVPWVENAFAVESFCDQAYEQVMEAYDRLRRRLGVPNEDEDVEIIINQLQEIQKELCTRSFAYGLDYAAKMKR